jgi:hypothetical protein
MFETRTCEFMVVPVLPPGLRSPTFEAPNNAHMTTWHRNSSINSITTLCQLPGVGMGMKLHGKNIGTLLSC